MNAVLTLRLARQLSAAHSRAALKLLMPAAYDAFVVAGSELCRTCVCVVVCVVFLFFLYASVNVSWLISPQHVKTLALDLKCCCARKRQEKKGRIKASLPRSAPSHTM